MGQNLLRYIFSRGDCGEVREVKTNSNTFFGHGSTAATLIAFCMSIRMETLFETPPLRGHEDFVRAKCMLV